LERLFYL